MQTLSGKVAHIIYQNSGNGYTVMAFKTDGEGEITAVGDGFGIEVGDKLELTGDYTMHKTYGEQFGFVAVNKVMPEDSTALVDYIASSSIKGLGKKTAEKIVKAFGDESLDVIRYKPDLLMDIKGINDEKAYALSEYMNDEWEKWNLTHFLAEHGIGLKTSMKIYSALGINAISLIKENPYSLMTFVSSLDFKTVDKFAMSLNIDHTFSERINTGIIYLLSYFIREGNTCTEKELLTEYAVRMLEVDEALIENAYVSLKMKDKIVIEEVKDKEFVYRKSMYAAERNIAEHLKELTMLKCKQYNLEKDIEEVSQNLSIVLSETQHEAVKTCINSTLSVITGGPGTGKTTIIKCIIDILKRRNLNYVLAAPTGRAAKRITETTGENAKTIHRMLEITKMEDTDIDGMVNYPIDVVDTDVVIVDEASMIDVLLMNNLIKALKKDTKLIIVGDADQLPSVGAGTVLKDIIESKVAETVQLTEIYRQSATSDIVVNAHKVKTGEHIEFKTGKDVKTDMYFIETTSVEKTVNEIVSLVDTRLYKKYDKGFLGEIQVLSGIKKSPVGVNELNKVLQKVYLKPTEDMVHKTMGEKTFYIGDKVMQIVNNYDIEWDLDGVRGTGVFNGDMGKISSINTLEKYLTVVYDDGKKVKYDFDILEELDLAYAITVHKSQGSEFKTVIMPLYVAFEKLFNRNLIYTAMTRAKNLLIFVGKKSVLNYMIDNLNSNIRYTGLKRKLSMEGNVYDE